MKHFIKEYAVEIASAILIIVGIFLMVDFTIRGIILAALAKIAKTLLGTFMGFLAGIDNGASTLSPAELVGGLLILLAVSFIVWRIRYRFQTGKRWTVDYCPKCSGPIMRVHRNLWDRLLGATFFPEARRYRCVDTKCGWSGLLRRHIHHRRHRSEPVTNPEKT
jgi:hypothetical protein